MQASSTAATQLYTHAKCPPWNLQRCRAYAVKLSLGLYIVTRSHTHCAV